MMKKILCGLLAASLAAGALVSCGSDGGSSSSSGSSGTESSASASESSEESSSSSGETSTASGAYTPNFDEEPYTVHFQYLITVESGDQQLVNDKINELAMEALNMQVELIPQTMGTWQTTLPMMLAAGEPLDFFVGTSNTFGTYIESGYMNNLADYLDYMPDIVETLGDDLNACYIGDFLTGIPMMKERGNAIGICTNKAITDELGFSEDDFNITTEDYSTYEQLDALFAAVKEAYPDMQPLAGTNIMANMVSNYVDTLGNNYGVLADFGQTTTITNWFESDQYLELCKIARRWFEAGYISADAATSQDVGEQLMRMGTAFSAINNIKPNTDIERLSQVGYEVYVIPMAQTTYVGSSALSGMVYSMSSASEDPVKAAAFYNWAFSSGEFNDTINWGVEGVHWVEDENGMAAYPEGVDSTNTTYHHDFGWCYPNQFVGHPWAGNDADIWEQYDEYNASNIRSMAFGFNFDSTVVSNEISACDTVYQQYYRDLSFGAIDPEANIDAFNDALYGAGLQTIMDEKQAQLDAWLAEQG